MKKKDLVKEIEMELAARLRIWHTADKSNKRFISGSHQMRFDTMQGVRNLIDCMTDKEVAQFFERIKRREKAAENKKSLF